MKRKSSSSRGKPEEALEPKDVSMSLLEGGNDADGDEEDQMNSVQYWQTSAEEVAATKDVKAPGSRTPSGMGSCQCRC